MRTILKHRKLKLRTSSSLQFKVKNATDEFPEFVAGYLYQNLFRSNLVRNNKQYLTNLNNRVLIIIANS